MKIYVYNFRTEDGGDSSSETSAEIDRTTWRYIPDNSILQFS
jgi:hypothetical protein